MTSGGEAVEVALQAFVEALQRRAELQSVALDDIRARLISVGQIMRESPADAAKVQEAVVESLLTDLAASRPESDMSVE
jgi:hypothetical protein